MRNHDLKIGEVLFDTDKRLFGVLIELKDGKAKLDMDAQPHDTEKLPVGWCYYQNRTMFDTEVDKDPGVWETENLEALYQVAWGIKDERADYIVCYEHDEDEGFPYYSPYLEEPLDEDEIYEI